jgi:hypothetical protein|tara:strand:+ start:1273 stop:1401 length:129 start_codon:yes stop_codon:yes gene_type:complete
MAKNAAIADAGHKVLVSSCYLAKAGVSGLPGYNAARKIISDH